MKTSRKTKLRFADMSRDYATLCRMHLPRPIHDKADYENTAEVAERFAGFEHMMNEDQNDYFVILCNMMEEWEKDTVAWPEVTGLAMLKHMLENHALNGADLSRILGASAKLGPMILRGERKITADHARALGKHFGVAPGLFL